MAKKPSSADAQLVLKLYELRREPEMRKARDWWLADFAPRNADDFMKVASALGTQENKWLRQVGGYWGMAAALVLQGTLNRDLFLKPAVSGEMFVLFAKVAPFIKELREKLGDPEAFGDIETVIASTKWGRDRLKFMEKRMQAWRERMEQKS